MEATPGQQWAKKEPSSPNREAPFLRGRELSRLLDSEGENRAAELELFSCGEGSSNRLGSLPSPLLSQPTLGRNTEDQGVVRGGDRGG